MLQQVQNPLRHRSLDAGPQKASLRIGSLHRNPCVADLRFFRLSPDALGYKPPRAATVPDQACNAVNPSQNPDRLQAQYPELEGQPRFPAVHFGSIDKRLVAPSRIRCSLQSSANAR